MTTIKTKRGMASLYLVAFTTLLVSITTLSFAQIMLTESEEASRSDLSQSAYDSALAGIEDAKTALIMYDACLNDMNANPGGRQCTDIVSAIEDGSKSQTCDVVSNVFGTSFTSENAEHFTSVGVDNFDQGYTCVTITNDTTDYRSTLNASNRTRIIPVRTAGEQYKDVVGIEIRWHSYIADDDFEDEDEISMNEVSQVYTSLFDKDISPFGSKSVAEEAYPIVAFELFQTDQTFSMSELDLNNETNTGSDHATIVLYPKKTADNNPNAGYRDHGESGTFISASDLLAVSGKDSNVTLNTDSDYENNLTPKVVTCGYGYGSNSSTSYRCRATIEFPATYKNNNYKGNDSDFATKSTYAWAKNNLGLTRGKNTFLFRVSLPYGAPETDFSVRLCGKIENNVCVSSETIDFVGVQAIVDSTGQAGTFFRRVAARVELNSGAIYPEFAIQTNGSNATVNKRFYVTNNCWSTDGTGNATSCANNGDAR